MGAPSPLHGETWLRQVGSPIQWPQTCQRGTETVFAWINSWNISIPMKQPIMCLITLKRGKGHGSEKGCAWHRMSILSNWKHGFLVICFTVAGAYIYISIDIYLFNIHMMIMMMTMRIMTMLLMLLLMMMMVMMMCYFSMSYGLWQTDRWLFLFETAKTASTSTLPDTPSANLMTLCGQSQIYAALEDRGSFKACT